ncbi:MAG: GDYXXLXY domain-containing protein [Desulfobacteraceae bacterium]|nr:GDYXXLXY domain-containing protein [Desulfobacteraceae bacterium]
MNKRMVFAGLAVVVAFQFVVLAAEYLSAAYPLWTGEQIRLKTVPVDPRSIFMGNYALLRYEISSINAKEFGEGANARKGDFVYVRLKPGPGGLHVFAGAGFQRPEKGPFIRGRVRSSQWDGDGKVEIAFGIEAFFAPKKKALELEKDLRQGGVAVLMVSGNGKAALKEVVPDQK